MIVLKNLQCKVCKGMSAVAIPSSGRVHVLEFSPKRENQVLKDGIFHVVENIHLIGFHFRTKFKKLMIIAM